MNSLVAMVCGTARRPRFTASNPVPDTIATRPLLSLRRNYRDLINIDNG
jgi:hypothetical protein